MVRVRLLNRFVHHHHELPEGLIIGLPAEMADRFVRLNLAEMAEPVKAVITPEETRALMTRPRGRPKRMP